MLGLSQPGFWSGLTHVHLTRSSFGPSRHALLEYSHGACWPSPARSVLSWAFQPDRQTRSYRRSLPWSQFGRFAPAIATSNLASTPSAVLSPLCAPLARTLVQRAPSCKALLIVLRYSLYAASSCAKAVRHLLRHLTGSFLPSPGSV